MATNTKINLKISPKLLYGELSYKLNGILFSVHNELGSFAREKLYADLVETKLKTANLKFSRGSNIGDSGNITDFMIEGNIVLELKAKPVLTREDYSQVKRYSRQTGLKLGVLVNLRPKFLQPKRVLGNIRGHP